MSKRQLFQSSFTVKLKAQRQDTTPSPGTSKDTNNEVKQSELRSYHPVNTLDQAVSVIDKTCNGIGMGYSVIPWKTFTKNWDKRALIFCESEILCLSNTLQDVGWAVCRHVRHGFCIAKSGTKRYQPKIGNATFHRHVDFHNNETKANFEALVVVSKEQKNNSRLWCRCRCTLQSPTELLREEARHDQIFRSASLVGSVLCTFRSSQRG